MAGNSQRRGATRKGKNKAAGSGGRIKRSLEGRGPTPKAEDRTYHKAYKAKQAAAKRQQTAPKRPGKTMAGADWIVGRNPVYEALAAGLLADALGHLLLEVRVGVDDVPLVAGVGRRLGRCIGHVRVSFIGQG